MALSNDELLTLFTEQHLVRNSITEHRRYVTHLTLNRLAAHTGVPLTDTTPQQLMAWQSAELTRGLSPNTLRNRNTMVSAFLSWAYMAGLIDPELYAQLKSVSNARGGSVKIQPRPYAKRELERWRELLDAKFPLVPTAGRGSRALDRYFRGGQELHSHARRHAIRLQFDAQVSLALEEGLRRVEIFRLTLPELHYDNATVVVQTAKQEPGQYRVREVPYTEHSRECVQAWLEFRKRLPVGHKHPWLRLTPAPSWVHDVHVLDPQTFQQFSLSPNKVDKVYKWCRWRHTFATNRLRAGVPLEQLQRMLGHAKLEQTLSYAELVNDDVEREADRTEAEFARLIGTAA